MSIKATYIFKFIITLEITQMLLKCCSKSDLSSCFVTWIFIKKPGKLCSLSEENPFPKTCASLLIIISPTFDNFWPTKKVGEK